MGNVVDLSNIVDQKFAKIEFESKNTNQNVDNEDTPEDADKGIPILCLRDGGNCEETITKPRTTTTSTTTTTTRSRTTTTTTSTTTTTPTTTTTTTTTPRPRTTESPRLFPSPTPRSKPVSPSLSLPMDICKLDDPTRYLVPHPTDCNKFVSCQWLGGEKFKPNVMLCPVTTQFDHDLSICNFGRCRK